MKKRCPCCSSSRRTSWRTGAASAATAVIVTAGRRCGIRSGCPACTKARLLEMFVLGVPVFRQRFGRRRAQRAWSGSIGCARDCCAWEEQLREPFDGALERDQTTFRPGAARQAGLGRRRQGHRVWGGQTQWPVKAMPIAAHNQLEATREIQADTREGSLYYTDEWQAYATLRTRGEHVMIRKEKGRPLGRDPHQRHRGLLELRQELAISVPRRPHQILPSLPG